MSTMTMHLYDRPDSEQATQRGSTRASVSTVVSSSPPVTTESGVVDVEDDNEHHTAGLVS